MRLESLMRARNVPNLPVGEARSLSSSAESTMKPLQVLSSAQLWPRMYLRMPCDRCCLALSLSLSICLLSRCNRPGLKCSRTTRRKGCLFERILYPG